MTSQNKSRPTLAAVAICKNEERDLPGFLDHLSPWIDEVVVVDDGSTDRSMEILRAAGGHVTVVEREMDDGGFSAQRNAGIDAACADWLIHMDIDERITPQLALEIRQEIANTDLNAFRYRRLNYFLHRPMGAGGWERWNRPQIARRGAHHFKNRIHEECVIDGGESCIGQLESRMHHLIDGSYVERLAKSFKYCQRIAEQKAERGERVSPMTLALRPALLFLKRFIVQRGITDGTAGFIAAMNTAGAEFRSLAILWDEQNKIERQQLEQRLAREWSESSVAAARAPDSSL